MAYILIPAKKRFQFAVYLKVGTASDLWSICCVVYEMIYEDSPYEYLIRRLYAWYSMPRGMAEHLILAMIIDQSQKLVIFSLGFVSRRDLL